MAAEPQPLPAAIRARIPDHPACHEALALVQTNLPPSIVNHSLRVYLYAEAFQNRLHWSSSDPPLATSAASSVSTAQSFPGPVNFVPAPEDTVTTDGPNPRAHDRVGVSPLRIQSRPVPLPALFVASMLHDYGVAPCFCTPASSPERFEVTGADVAVRILRQHGFDEECINGAWLSMALHTSPHVAERLGGTVMAFRIAILFEFDGVDAPSIWLDEIAGLVALLPRLEIVKVLGDAVVAQAERDRRKAPPRSWAADMLRWKEENPEWTGDNGVF
jgi:hypothetical protein